MTASSPYFILERLALGVNAAHRGTTWEIEGLWFRQRRIQCRKSIY